MPWSLVAAAAIATTPVPDAEVSQAPEPLAPGENAELVEGEADYHNRMTVPVHIEGEGPFDFMIDTGAEATVVTRTLKEQLGLKPAGNAVVVGMASRVPVELVSVDGLEFAARVIDGIEAPMLEKRHVGADGILGLDSLQDLRVLIDFREDTIAVDDAKALGGNRGYEIIVRARRKLGRLIITEATLNNVRTAVIIDTGAQTSIGNLALQRKMRAKNRETIRSTDVNGHDLVGALDFARTLKMGGMQINNLPILYADGPAFEQLGLSKRPAMILGMRDLRIFDRVAIDFNSRQILFDVPSGAGFKSNMTFGNYPSRL